jgi:hypothetical protein
LAEDLKHRFRVNPIDDIRAYLRKIRRRFAHWLIRETLLTAASLKELSMQRSEQPSFDACQIFELMSFGRPNVEGLLGEIASISLTSGETKPNR